MIRRRERLLTVLVFCSVLWLTTASAHATPCSYTIGLDVKTADARTNFSAVKAGDTVCIAAGNRNSLTLKNFQGTASSPITFINSGGRVVLNGTASFALFFRNCRYYRLTGTGDSSVPYGIYINGTYQIGVRNGNKSSDFELDHIEATGSALQEGIGASTKPSCPNGYGSTTTQPYAEEMYDYDGDGRTDGDLGDRVCQEGDTLYGGTGCPVANAFTLRNARIHHNYLHDLQQEGMYLGNNRTVYASYAQGEGNAECPNDTPTLPLEPTIESIWVYNNRIVRSGSAAVTIKGAPVDCRFYGNDVTEFSTHPAPGQEGALHINLNSKCDVYDNFMKDGHSAAIIAVGIGGKIYNNVIINPGRDFLTTDPRGSGIRVLSGTAEKSYLIQNNTIVNPKSWGILFNYNHGTSNKIQNNIVVNPGVNGQTGDRRFIYETVTAPITVSNNSLTLNIADMKFKDPVSNNYSLLSGSPALDAGTNLTSSGITQDYVGVARPQGLNYDIGAYEYLIAPGIPKIPTGLRIVE